MPPVDRDGMLFIHARCLAYFDRIKSLNPQLNAYAELLETSALAVAHRQDSLHEAGKSTGSLTGLAAAVKNNINTPPATANAGLPFLRNHRPPSDATAIKLLRDNGAIILGVTETDSGAFGVLTPKVTNPVYPDRFVGGSSGGSAAAVAANLCDFAIGTDTGGSIRVPAACCGIFGFKPTINTIPLDGVRLLTRSFDHLGTMARSVKMIERALHVLSNAPKDRNPQDWDAPPILDTKVIGIPWDNVADSEPAVLRALEDFAATQTRAGFAIRSVRFPEIAALLDVHIKLSLREAAELYDGLPQEHRSVLPDIVKISLQMGNSVSDATRVALEAKKLAFSAAIDAAIGRVDFIVLPTLPFLPPLRSAMPVQFGAQDIDLLGAMIRYTAIFNQTGHPVLAFPWAGRDADVLSSLQLVGPKNSDFRLLSFAREGLKI